MKIRLNSTLLTERLRW